MVIAPSHYSLRTFPFVDRVKCKKIFQNFIETSEQKQYNVLHFYGISGIGKSKLQQELQSILTEENQDGIWANVDFKVKNHREIGTFLFSLRSQLAGKYKIKFDYFDIAHAVYWKKVNPEVALAKEKYGPIEENSIVDIMFKILDIYGPFSLIADISKYLAHVPQKFENWLGREGFRFINKLNEANPNEIEQLLPLFFITDLKGQLEHKSKKAIFFIDTYEALWEEARNLGNFNSKDEWIRSIIAIFENVSWVICGQNKLRWSEVDNDWDNYLIQHEIGILPKEYCIEFLESCKVDEKDIQSVILESSEGYAYYLALSVDTYFAIKEKGKEPSSEDLSKTRHEIFNHFFHYLNEAERSTLLILSGANFWDRNLINLLIEEFGTNYPKSEMAFDELHRFSFIRKNSEGTWSMHSLMRNSLQENQKPEQKEKVHKYLFNYYDQQLNTIDIRKIEEIHKTAFNEAVYHGKQFMGIEHLFSWFLKRSEIFKKAGFWDFLIPLYDEICNILEKMLGSEHPDVATSLNDQALLYRSMGKFEQALPLYQRALEIREKILGMEHPDVASSLNNLAGFYKSMGKYKQALPLFERALTIREKVLGSEHLDVASSLNDLAGLYRLMGKYEQALSLYNQALEIKEKMLGLENPSVAISFNNLALLYRSMGKYEEALPIYDQALKIKEKMLGSEHPSVATTLNNLAGVYRAMGRYEEALSLCNRALKIKEKMLGIEHRSFVNSLNNLALLYDSMGRYEEALPLFERALAIREKIFDPEHPDIASSLNNLAVFYDSIGKYEEALPLFERALAIREKVLDSEHRDVASSLNGLAELYCSMGKYEEALPLYQRSLSIREKTLGKEHPDYATVKDSLDTLLLKLRQ